MTDPFPPEKRSAIMRAVPGRHTTPELAVRRLVHGLGYRYRLHDARLPGQPDLVLPRLRTVILVHGCFWHQHRCPRGDRRPAARPEYWLRKLANNQRRDRRQRAELRKLGWRVIVVWECQTRRPDVLRRRLARLLASAAGAVGARRPSPCS